MIDPITLGAAQRAHEALGHIIRSPGQDYSLSRAILTKHNRQPQSGFEFEISRRIAEIDGGLGLAPLPLTSFFAPWSILAMRGMSTQPGGAGGFATPVQTSSEIVDLLRPYSVSARAGITVMEQLRSGTVLPRTTSKATIVWQGPEFTSVNSSTPALGSISLVPRTATGVVELSLQLLRQGPAADTYVRRELGRTLGTAIDQAILNGDGSAQPLGILNTENIQTQSGTSLNLAGVTHMKQLAATADADDASIAFLTTPTVRETLENREIVSTSGRMVWSADRVADRPAYVTTDMPAATMICADWSDVVLAIFGAGVQIDVANTNFDEAQVGIRVMVNVDVAVLHPESWVAASSIT
jgi:HK97 family phage major capsid protein